MFHSSFEHLLFKKLIVDNPNVMHTGDETFEPTWSNFKLGIPRKFTNKNYKKQQAKVRFFVFISK